VKFGQDILEGKVSDAVVQKDNNICVLANEEVPPPHVEIGQLVELVEVLLAHLAQDNPLEVRLLVDQLLQVVAVESPA